MIRKPKFQNSKIIIHAQLTDDYIFMRYDNVVIPVTRKEFDRRIKKFSWHYSTLTLNWVDDVFNIKEGC